MHATASAGVHWVPSTEAERAAVLTQMDRLLNSRHFRNSKRYPVLLEYLIRQTLTGHSDSLKERLLGVAVFHRPADYDANADPVVRVTAAEIRRRIAQFYQEEGRFDEMYIGLKPGSYVPEFVPVKRELNEVEGPVTVPVETAVAPSIVSPTSQRIRFSWRFSLLAAGIALVIAVSVMALWHWRSQQDQHAQLWSPFLDSPAPVLFVIGQPHAADSVLRPPENAYDLNAASELYIPDAIALAHLSSVLDAHSHLYQIVGVTAASLSDLRKGPAVLVGGFNNPWTLRLLSPLRYSFASIPGSAGSNLPRVLQITDRKKQPGSPWTLDLQQPINAMGHDYAIIARFQSSMTDGQVMVVAGLGAGGTESASKFINSATFMKELAARAPQQWSRMNMEAVLETEVIGGRPGHTHIVATEFW